MRNSLSLRRTRTIERVRFAGISFFVLSCIAFSATVIAAILIDAGMLAPVWWNLGLAASGLLAAAACLCFALSSDL